MHLASRVRGAALAAHGVYHSLEYFRGVTGLRTSELLVCKKTETYVRTCTNSESDFFDPLRKHSLQHWSQAASSMHECPLRKSECFKV